MVIGKLFGIEAAAEKLTNSVMNSGFIKKTDSLLALFNGVAGYALENGLSADFKEHRAQKNLSVSININTGSMADPEGQEGMAHLIEHMAFFRQEKFIDAIRKELEKRGGAWEGLTNLYGTKFNFEIPYSRSNSRFLMETVSKIVFSNEFDQEQLDEEQNVIDNELYRDDDGTKRDIQRLLNASIGLSACGEFDQTIGEKILGRGNTRKSITLNDLKTFHRDNYVATNAQVKIACPRGTKGRLFRLLKDNFSDVPSYGTQSEVEENIDKPYQGGENHLDIQDLRQTHFALAFYMPKATGGRETVEQRALTSYIEKRLKDEMRGVTNRRVYQTYAYIGHYEKQSFISISTSVKPEQADTVLPIVANIIKEISEGRIDKDRFKAVKAGMRRQNLEKSFNNRTSLENFNSPLKQRVSEYRDAKYSRQVEPKDLTQLINEALTYPPTMLTAGNNEKVQTFESFRQMLPEKVTENVADIAREKKPETISNTRQV